MIASGFKPVGWAAGVGAAALGCYMLSLQVASERASLAGLDHRIVAAQQQIRSLQTELGTRGRIQQLEAWNDEVLALSAPVSGQFVEGQVSLARFDTRQPQIADTANVRMASADTGAATIAPAPAAHSAVPQPQRAVATAGTVAPPTAVPPARIQHASLTLVPAPTAAAPSHPRATSAPARATQLADARVPNIAGRAVSNVDRTRPAAAPAATGSAKNAASARVPVQTAARQAPALQQARGTTAPARPASAVVRTAAPAATPRSSNLLGERAMRDLRAASRAERDRGTDN